MGYTAGESYPVAKVQGKPPDVLRQHAHVINNIMRGKVNATGTVTLTANAATTTVTDFRATPECVILLMPTTANASAEQGAGTIYISSRSASDNQFVITHANNAQTDRTFDYVILG